jgi:membrane protein DedA with SNARE-associated domain
MRAARRGEVDAIVARLGPDPIRDDADPERAWAALQRRSVGIGRALMDQSVLAGVGNVYRAEVLFVHGLHPTSRRATSTARRGTRCGRRSSTWLRRGVKERRIITVDPKEVGVPARACGVPTRPTSTTRSAAGGAGPRCAATTSPAAGRTRARRASRRRAPLAHGGRTHDAHVEGAARMSATTGASVPPPLLQRVAIGVAIARYAIPLAVIPAIPFLIARGELALLVLLRPQKEFLLLAAAQLARTGAPSVALLFAAYVPLMIVAVWAFFIVGRIFRPALDAGEAPRWLTRILPPEQLDVGRRVIARRGPLIAVMGRMAALPPTIMAAAAGASDVDGRRYLPRTWSGRSGRSR